MKEPKTTNMENGHFDNNQFYTMNALCELWLYAEKKTSTARLEFSREMFKQGPEWRIAGLTLNEELSAINSHVDGKEWFRRFQQANFERNHVLTEIHSGKRERYPDSPTVAKRTVARPKAVRRKSKKKSSVSC